MLSSLRRLPLCQRFTRSKSRRRMLSTPAPPSPPSPNTITKLSTSFKTKYPRAGKAIVFSTVLYKIARYIAVGSSIYYIGYTHGIGEYAADPRKMEKSICHTLIMSQAYQAGSDDKPKKPELLPRHHPLHHRVEDVGEKIVQGSRMFVEAKIKSRLVSLRTNKSKDNTPLSPESVNRIKKEVAYWRGKLRMCKGSWQYIVISNPIPNAFVSDLAPRKIFVNTGLITTIDATDDELGLVLGHEISHLLHAHTTKGAERQYYMQIAQLILLGILPIDIFTPVLFWAANKFELFKTMEHSRSNETEADETGLKIAALACFNTHKGPNVFKKLAKVMEEHGGERVAHWDDSHPLPLDREETLAKMSASINCDNTSSCKTTLQRFKEVWAGKHETSAAEKQERSFTVNTN